MMAQITAIVNGICEKLHIIHVESRKIRITIISNWYHDLH